MGGGGMIAGRSFWVIIWVGILLLGLLGLAASVYWGRETRWRNFDELLRAVGTILVSTGMLLLLLQTAPLLGQGLLVVALVCFVLAFVYGRRVPPLPKPDSIAPDVDQPPRKGA